MRAHFNKLWNDARASYWFWPSIMAVAAIVLALVTVEIDATIDSDWPEKIPFIYSNQPDGARALLATVAGSMITVTGITFSLTLLAVSHATSQFGPRLLTNFMRDRGNQLTLGTFIATFLYCLMVLRTVRSADEAVAQGASGQDSSTATNELMGAFVPHVSVFVALLLTIASVGVLIYFIHHIPESIRLSNVVSNIGRELMKSVDELFPESVANVQPNIHSVPAKEKIPADFVELSCEILSNGDGYIQAIDEMGIVESAKKHDLVLQIHAAPGDFVSHGQKLMSAYPSHSIKDNLEAHLQFMFARGSHRTSTQNSMFLVDQLVEVIARALSPGVNDPMTAMTCMDWLQSGLIKIASRDKAENYRFDDEGVLRVLTKPVNFSDFCRSIFEQIRPYVATDRNAAIRLLQVISNVIESTDRKEYRHVLKHHANELIEAADANQMFKPDLCRLRQMAEGFEKDLCSLI